jgi:signal recognition particle GTPase
LYVSVNIASYENQKTNAIETTLKKRVASGSTKKTSQLKLYAFFAELRDVAKQTKKTAQANQP